ncbi:MAG TPA: GntR family transcriptional regulator [Burkholderiaceae bacterium]|nr:GntR family transcriptional regulator [Burkholderiaceae bacterium]
MQPDEIGRIIGDAILERRLAPGRKLNELELSKLLGVSRSLVHLALLGLHHDGLVSFEVNRGAFVARPTLDEAHFLFEAIAANERSAVDIVLAAPALPPLDGLRSVHNKQVKAHAKGQMRSSEQLAIDFHRELIALTGNPLLIDAQRKLLLRYRIVTAIFKTELDYCELEDHHGELIQLLQKSGSAARLRRLIDTHWRLVIRGHLSVQPGVEDLSEALRL